MNELTRLALLFLLGSFAGFMNVMAGGGSTLTLPMLIFLGLDSSLANGTNRIAILIQNLSAIISFKQEHFSQFKTSLKLAAFTLPGAIIGAMVAVNISNELFKRILGIVMIGVIFTLVIPKSKLKNLQADANFNPWLVYPALFGIVFYGGFIQVGVGFLLMASLHYLMKQSLVYVNMHKVFIVLIYTIPALLIFIYTDNVNWSFGLILASGNMIGAWWGAKFSVKGGEKVIKIILIVAIGLMSLKLFGMF